MVGVVVAAVVVAVEESTVLPDDVSGALGTVGAGAAVGVDGAATVVCVALVAVSVVLDVGSLSCLLWSLSKLNDPVEKRVTPQRRLGGQFPRENTPLPMASGRSPSQGLLQRIDLWVRSGVSQGREQQDCGDVGRSGWRDPDRRRGRADARRARGPLRTRGFSHDPGLEWA